MKVFVTALLLILVALFSSVVRTRASEAAEARQAFFAEIAERGLSRDQASSVWALFHISEMEVQCYNSGFVDVGFQERLAIVLLRVATPCVCKNAEKLTENFIAANERLRSEVDAFKTLDDDSRDAVCTKYRRALDDLHRGYTPAEWPYGGND